MFALIYKFPFPKNKLKEYLKIDKQADRIYREYGLIPVIDTPYLTRKIDENNVEILLITFYKSKKDYKMKIKRVDRDPSIINLFSKVTEIVPKEKIETFEYESI